MRIRLATAALVLSLTTAYAADPLGTWTRPSTGAQILFYTCGGNLCAKVISVKDPATKDRIGKVIIPGATNSGPNVWKGGFVNLEDGNTYPATITLANASALHLRGCAAGGLICKSETWRR
jgi:uncharacterized protein (DUF2147 family)